MLKKLFPHTLCFSLLDNDSSNNLVVGEEMNPGYPLFQIPETKQTVDKIIGAIRATGE